jgi:hypothetical protein
VNRVSKFLVRIYVCIRALFSSCLSNQAACATPRHEKAWPPHAIHYSLALTVSWDHFGLTLRQTAAKLAFFVDVRFLWLLRLNVSCFSLKPLCSTLSWPLCDFQPSLTSPLELVGPLWTRFAQRCGERRNSGALILVERVTKNQHLFRLNLSREIGAKHSFYCTICAHSTLYSSLSVMVEPPVPLNWNETASWMIFKQKSAKVKESTFRLLQCCDTPRQCWVQCSFLPTITMLCLSVPMGLRFRPSNYSFWKQPVFWHVHMYVYTCSSAVVGCATPWWSIRKLKWCRM